MGISVVHIKQPPVMPASYMGNYRTALPLIQLPVNNLGKAAEDSHVFGLTTHVREPEHSYGFSLAKL